MSFADLSAKVAPYAASLTDNYDCIHHAFLLFYKLELYKRISRGTIMENENKRRLLYIAKTLYESTDEERPLSHKDE